MTPDRTSGTGALRPHALWSAAFVSATSLTVHCLTAARDVTLGDAPELVAVARTLGVAHPPGYPLYTLLSALAARVPAGSPFLRLSVLSAVFAAGAAGVLSLLVWEMTAGRPNSGGSSAAAGRAESGRSGYASRLFGSVVAGLAFAVTPSLWSQATVPEVYTLSALLVFGMLFSFVRWRRLAEAGLLPNGIRGERLLWVGGLLLGLSLSHHLTAVLAVPSAAIALAAGHGRHAPSRSVWRMFLFVVAGFSLYAYLPLRSAQDPPLLWASLDSLPALLQHVVGAQYTSRLFAEPLPGVLAKLGSFLAGLPSELTWPALSLSAVGLAAMWVRSKRLFAVLILELALVLTHAANYRIPDVAAYYIPIYAVLSLCAGLAVAELPRLVAAGSARARVSLSAGLTCVVLFALYGHADALWLERDLRPATGGRLYLQRLLDGLPPDAIVLAQNDRTVFPLWYARFVEGSRPDVAVINTRDRASHLEKWYPGVAFPTEEQIAIFMGRDPDVPCVPPARQSLPVARYLPLLVSLNEADRPILADVDVGRDAFRDRAVVRGLLTEIERPAAGGTPRLDPSKLEEYVAELGPGGDRAVSAPDDGTREAYTTTLADLGQLLLVRGQVEDGIRVLEAARDASPDAAHIRNNLSVAYRSAGRLAEARREIQEAIDLAPGRASSYHNLSRLHLLTGDEETAARALTIASRLEPRDLRYRLELASLYERRGLLEDAEEVLSWVERNAGEDLPARLAYGDFLLRQERYTEAVAAYRRARESSPLSVGVFTSLSRCYWEMEQIDAAVEAMQRSVELQPHNPRLKYDLALMLSKSGSPEAALPHLDAVRRLLPAAWQPVALKASILGDLGMLDEARRLLEEARRMGAEGEQFQSVWSKLELDAGGAGESGEAAGTGR